jgi:hypothetical protein
MPFPKRTIWLIKILAQIVGAGGVFEVLADLTSPWYFAVESAGSVIFLGLKENVQEVVPSKRGRKTWTRVPDGSTT